MNKALGAKLIWTMFENPQLYWVRILKGKYLDSDETHRILTIRDPPKGSAIWNFMLSCRQLIVKHISWHIGDGKQAKFLEDSWNRHKVLGEEDGNLDLKAYFKDKWGNSIADYMTEKVGLLQREWCWKDVSNEELTDL